MKRLLKLLTAPIFVILLFSGCSSITDATAPAEAEQVESATPNKAKASINWPDKGAVTPSDK